MHLRLWAGAAAVPAEDDATAVAVATAASG
jgi:hypothetical protein